MAIEIEEIKNIRKKLGLTQKELADKAGVSQSLIAKVESNKIDPTYSNAKKIFSALDELSHKKEIKAFGIMTKKIVSVKLKDDIKKAIMLMKKHSISQLPVVEHNKSIGLVSESIILDAMTRNVEKIKDIMQDSPPIVSKNTGVSMVSDLLKFHALILVSDRGKLKGVITKSDLIGSLYK